MSEESPIIFLGIYISYTIIVVLKLTQNKIQGKKLFNKGWDLFLKKNACIANFKQQCYIFMWWP